MHRITLPSSRKRPRAESMLESLRKKAKMDDPILDEGEEHDDDGLSSIMLPLPAQPSYQTPMQSMTRYSLSKSLSTPLFVLLLYGISSVTTSLAPPVIPQRSLQMKHETTMFLDHVKASWAVPISPNVRRRRHDVVEEDHHGDADYSTSSTTRTTPNRRSVLGFDVETQLRSSVSSSSETNRETTAKRIVLPMGQMSYRFGTPPSTTAKAPSESHATKPIDTMTVVQLKSELEKYGLNKSGPKAVLQERLRAHMQHIPVAIDVAAILQRRKEIHKQKSQPKKKLSSVDARSVLQSIYQKPANSLESSQHASRVYQAAKEADQAGDRETAKILLRSLDSSHDARILRRLARMEHEDGNTEEAKNILRQGLEAHHKNNAYLWNGLANLEDAVDAKRRCYEKAIEVDPHIPHSYHALGTLEHTEGRIKQALTILKTGLKYCPTNHRLHHALGDLYRDAKVLQRATDSYQKAIEFGPEISRGYALTALAFCAYDEKNMNLCRQYLQQSVDRNPRQANAWVALAQFEESLGNDVVARETCRIAIAQYERGLLKKYRPKSTDYALKANNPVAYKNQLLSKLPRRRSGDKFMHVYRTWLRLEGRFGSRDDFEDVYHQASAAFPDVRIQLDAAKYYARVGLNEAARSRFMDATKCSSRDVEAFRLFGLHELRTGNYALARKIFYTGAMTGRSSGLAELLYTWAICEWHTKEYENASSLFDLALEESAEDGRLRAFILYVTARFEFARGEYHRAQHFVGRCLSEHEIRLPGGNEQVWTLWKQIAEATSDDRLAQHCHHQAWQTVLEEDEATRVQTGDLQQQMRREPWISTQSSFDQEVDSIYNLDFLPDSGRVASLLENELDSNEALVES